MINPAELPGNTNKSKERPPVTPEPKKIESVVTGPVRRQKTSLGKKFKETFFSASAGSVGEYIIFEVLVPAVKDTVSELVQQTIERALFGEVRPQNRRGPVRPGGTSYTSYNRFAQDPRQRPGPELPRQDLSRHARSVHNFDEIVLATRIEAETVIARMYELLERYDTVSVSDLYELVDISREYTAENWGWTELTGARAIRVRNGYMLDLPQPVTI